MSDRKNSAFDPLTADQHARLKRLYSELRFDKITVSFSIEDRDARGRKKTAFYSVTGSRGHGAEIPQMHEASASNTSFTPEDAKIIRCLLAKHVVASVYDDAAKRNIVGADEAREEARRIIASYDAHIVRALNKDNS